MIVSVICAIICFCYKEVLGQGGQVKYYLEQMDFQRKGKLLHGHLGKEISTIKSSKSK